MATTQPANIEIEELKTNEPLCKSRVSWGALMAGTVVAIVAYSLMTLLGIALAFNISDGATAKELATFAGVWSYITLILAMFLGGYISTLYTVGEFRYEAFLYGVVVWGVALASFDSARFSRHWNPASARSWHRIGLAKMTSVTEPLIVGAQEKFSNMGRRGEDLVADLGRRLSNAAKEKTSSDQSNSDSNSSSSDNQSSIKSSSDKSNSDPQETSSASNNSTDNNTAGTSGSSSTTNTSTSSSSDVSQQDTRQDNSSDDRTISKETRSKLTAGAWYAFGGTLISVLAAVFGASIGPTFHVKHYKIPVRRTPVVAARV